MMPFRLLKNKFTSRPHIEDKAIKESCFQFTESLSSTTSDIKPSYKVKPKWLRLIVFADLQKMSIQNGPSRRLLIDTSAIDYSDEGFVHCAMNSKSEYRLLSELAFGNVDLAFKGDGFKVHLLHHSQEILYTQSVYVPFDKVKSQLHAFNKQIRKLSSLSALNPTHHIGSAPISILQDSDLPFPASLQQHIFRRGLSQSRSGLSSSHSSSSSFLALDYNSSFSGTPSISSNGIAMRRSLLHGSPGVFLSNFWDKRHSTGDVHASLEKQKSDKQPFVNRRLIKLCFCVLMKVPPTMSSSSSLSDSDSASTTSTSSTTAAAAAAAMTLQQQKSYDNFCSFFFRHVVHFNSQLGRLMRECVQNLHSPPSISSSLSLTNGGGTTDTDDLPTTIKEKWLKMTLLATEERARTLLFYFLTIQYIDMTLLSPISYWLKLGQNNWWTRYCEKMKKSTDNSSSTSSSILSSSMPIITSTTMDYENSFFDLLRFVLDRWHKKESQYFLASLLTGVLMTHHSWVSSVYPQHPYPLLPGAFYSSASSHAAWERFAQTFSILKEPAQCAKIVLISTDDASPLTSSSSASSKAKLNLEKQTLLTNCAHFLTYFIRYAMPRPTATTTTVASVAAPSVNVISHDPVQEENIHHYIIQSNNVVNGKVWRQVNLLSDCNNYDGICQWDVNWHIRPKEITNEYHEGLALQCIIIPPPTPPLPPPPSSHPPSSKHPLVMQQHHHHHQQEDQFIIKNANDLDRIISRDLVHTLNDCEGFHLSAIESNAIVADVNKCQVKLLTCRNSTGDLNKNSIDLLNDSSSVICQIITPSLSILRLLDQLHLMVTSTAFDPHLCREYLEYHLRLLCLRAVALLDYCLNCDEERLIERQQLCDTLQIDPSDVNLLLGISSALHPPSGASD